MGRKPPIAGLVTSEPRDKGSVRARTASSATRSATLPEEAMKSPFADSANFTTVAPYCVSDRERGLEVMLADGPGPRIEDANGSTINHTLEFRFSGVRLWIPCFTRNEKYTLIFKGSERVSSYIGMCAVPRNVAEITFSKQFSLIFGRLPLGEEVAHFWIDVEAVVHLFQQYARSYYEQNVRKPVTPRFIVFEHAMDVGHVDWTTMNWRELASSASVAMDAAAEA